MTATRTKTELKFRRLPDSRPDQIMSAAEKVFGKYGYEAATLEKIAKAAGITKGTIYLYFKNKKDLFIRMMQRKAVSMITGFSENASNTEPFKDFLSIFLPAFRGFIRDPGYPNFLRLLLAESGRFPGLGRDFFQAVFTRAIPFWSGLYRNEVNRGELKDLDPRIVLRCLLGMHVIFVVTQEILGGKDFDPLDWDEVANTIETIFLEGVKRGDQHESP